MPYAQSNAVVALSSWRVICEHGSNGCPRYNARRLAAVTAVIEQRRIAFRRIAEAALEAAPALVPRWLPEGRRECAEWVAINPTRGDKRRGSFKVNLRTGRWSDFAVDASGGDLIALAAYLFHLTQGQAAVKIAAALGIHAYE